MNLKDFIDDVLSQPLGNTLVVRVPVFDLSDLITEVKLLATKTGDDTFSVVMEKQTYNPIDRALEVLEILERNDG